MPAEKDQMDEEKEFFFDDCAVSDFEWSDDHDDEPETPTPKVEEKSKGSKVKDKKKKKKLTDIGR